jgi:two-component system cell cycle sensor histidine kinase PleC
VKLPCETVSARDEVHSVMNEVAAEAAEKKLAISLATGADVLAACDARSLKRVLANIVRNAIKFTDDGGTIDISVSRQGETARIAVKDTGIGIPAAMLHTIGKPFVQVEGNLARKNSGVGLGLAIASALIKLMHGTLTIESASGRGTIATVILPLAEAAPARVSEPVVGSAAVAAAE